MDRIYPGINPVLPIVSGSGAVSGKLGAKDIPIGRILLPEGGFYPDESATKADGLSQDILDYKNGAQTADHAGGEKSTQPIGDGAAGPGTAEAAILVQDADPPIQQVSSYDQFGRSTAKQAAAPDSEIPLRRPNGTAANPKDLSELNKLLSDLQIPFPMRQDIPSGPAVKPLPAGQAAAHAESSADSAENTAGSAEAADTGANHTARAVNPMNRAPASDIADIPDAAEIHTAHPAEKAVLSQTPAQKTAGTSEAGLKDAAPELLAAPEKESVPPKQAAAKMIRVLPDQAGTAPVMENEEIRELSEGAGSHSPGPVQDAERAVNGPAAYPGGTMANLGKITQLPYALYLFGDILPKPPDGPKEDEDPFVFDKSSTAAPPVSSDFLRLAEAIKMASILHSLYHGGTGLFEQDTPWYLEFVNYAVRSGIIAADDFPDYNDYATRAEAAYIFSNCVPSAELPVINDKCSLSDVGKNTRFADRIRLLCRAGVLTGDGSSENFYPDRLLTRSEAASIIGRIATPSDRRAFRPG